MITSGEAEVAHYLKSKSIHVKGYAGISPGKRLRSCRELMEMTQKQLELRSGVQQSVISAIETDRRQMGLAVARKLARGLDVPLSRLLESDEPSREIAEAPTQVYGMAELAERFGTSESTFVAEMQALASRCATLLEGQELRVQRRGGQLKIVSDE